MSTNEKMEKFLRGMALPAYESEEHRRRLRSQILSQLAASRSSRPLKRAWRLAALGGGLLGAGVLAAAVTVQVHRYFFEGRTADGSYTFSSQPQTLRLQGVTVMHAQSAVLSSDELGGGGIEQAQNDLDEIDRLRSEGAVEIKGVTDTEVNGHSLGRVFHVEYFLTDGRTITMNEGNPDSWGRTSPAEIEREQEQIAELRAKGQRDITTIFETELDGGVDRTLICRYLMPEGREITIAEGDPQAEGSAAHLSAAQRDELRRLAGLNAGTFIGSVERQMFGRCFTFERYSYKLADGGVAVRAEGRPTGAKQDLTKADRNELANLTKAGAGELLGRYEQEVRGKLFSFEKTRYVLSDGTLVIRSRGAPKADH